jgi:hypothetical protein
MLNPREIYPAECFATPQPPNLKLTYQRERQTQCTDPLTYTVCQLSSGCLLIQLLGVRTQTERGA